MPKLSNKMLRCDDGRDGRNVRSVHNYCRDDRVSYHGTRAKVSFKTQARRGKDVPMYLASEHINQNIKVATNSNNNRQDIMAEGNKGTQPGRNRRVRVPKQKQLPLEESSWYKITIPHGHKYEKDYILCNLLNYIEPETFVPIMYKVSRHGTNFYVDDYKVAVALFNCNRKITTTQGYKLIVRVTVPPFPQCQIDAEFNEKLKQVIGKRYISATKALDLSKLHEDPILISHYFCALFQPSILETVINIVSQHMPDLEVLNLDRNKLDMIEPLCSLKPKLLKLKILHIGDNSIKDMKEINAIKDLKLEELKLAGNPMCNDYQTPNDYIEDVKKRFPELLRLDSIDLAKLVLCDAVDEKNNMPTSETKFVANTQAQQFVREFLQQYFLTFDSEKREPLLKAYAKDACFTMIVSDNARNPNKLNGYLRDDRKNNTKKQQTILKQGRLQIVAYFYEMPRTSHYVNTLNMDISMITESMMLVAVTGMFKELDKEEQPIRYFNRSLTIISEENGCCIKKEQLHITQPTEQQLKQLNSQPNVQEIDLEANTIVQEIQSLDSVAYPAAEMTDQEAQMTDLKKQMSSLSMTETSQVELPVDVKQNVTLKLSEQKNMDLQCLVQNSWNYDNAFSAFQTFLKQESI